MTIPDIGHCAGSGAPPVEGTERDEEGCAKSGVCPACSGRFELHLAPDTFDDGHALYRAVCEHGLEGVVAKRSASTYRPGQRGWIKIKNPGYWRRNQERESLRRSLERRVAA